MKRTTLPGGGRLLLLAGLLLALCNGACKKEDHDVQPAPPPAKGHPTAVGTPAGDPVTKAIGAEGGTLATADGKILLQIPGGALTTTQTVGIQPITSTNPSGKGKAYRLTPHGVKFNQPVRITFAFGPADLAGNLPEALGMAYQDAAGVWQYLGGTQLDKAAGTLTVATTHFSDWSFFERFWLDPWAARVDLKGSVNIKVMTVDPDLAAPLPAGGERALGEPAVVQDGLIKQWRFQSDGTLIGTTNNRTYFAPDHLPDTNPEAVSVELNLPERGTFLLVSNITVGNPPHISYLQVDESTSELYIYGSGFGNPGTGTPVVVVDGEVQGAGSVQFFGDQLIKCWIPASGKGSSGPVVVIKEGVSSTPHVLNEWNPTLVYHRPCAGKSNGDLYQKIIFKLRFRGDVHPDFQEGETLRPLLSETGVNANWQAFYEAGGQGRTSYTLHGCATETVTYSHVTGDLPAFTHLDNMKIGFTGQVETLMSGFVLTLDVAGPELIPARYVMEPCKGDTYTDQYRDALTWEDFADDKLRLLFKGSSLAGGRLAELTSPAPNLHWDNPATGPSPWVESFVDATLTWAETPAKYPDGVVVK